MYKLIRELRRLILAIDNLKASVDALETAAQKLIASQANTVPQADVDAQQVRIDAVTAELVSATPAAPAAPVV